MNFTSIPLLKHKHDNPAFPYKPILHDFIPSGSGVINGTQVASVVVSISKKKNKILNAFIDVVSLCLFFFCKMLSVETHLTLKYTGDVIRNSTQLRIGMTST